MQITKGHLKNIIILMGISLVFFMLGNNLLAMTNPDEVFYSLSAKEMIQQNTWLVPHIFGEPQFEKPILSFWLIRLSFCVFGINNFAARFPTALFAILGGLTVYYFCQLAYRNKNKSFLFTLILISSGLYIGLARFLLTDMIFSVFILMSLVAFYAGYIQPGHKRAGILLFFVFSALAVLTKGLLGVVLPLFIVLLFLIMQKNLKFIFTSTTLYGVIIFMVLALPWYGYMVKQYGNSFIQEFFYNDHIRRILEAEHSSNDSWYFYPLTMILGMLPWSIFVVASFGGFIKKVRENAANPVYHFLLSWVLVVFIAFQMAHSKLISYIMPLIPALAIITGNYIATLFEKKKNKTLFIMVFLSSLLLLGVSFVLFLLSSGYLPIEFKYYEYVPDAKLIIGLLILSLAIAGGAIFSSLTQRHKRCFYILALQVPLLLMLVFLSRNRFENYVSSKEVSEYLVANHTVQNKILCSKMFARGVRYYTDKDIAVIGGQFFSPHPVPVVDTDKEVLDFLKSQGRTYAIVRKDQYDQISRVSKDQFEFKELLHAGDAYVLSINHM